MAIEVSRWPKPIALLLPENLQHLARLRLCLPWQYATGVPAGWEAVGQAERSGAVACSVLLGSGLLSGLGGAQRIDGVGDWHNECSRGRCPQGGREPPPADGTKRCFRALACQTRRPSGLSDRRDGPAMSGGSAAIPRAGCVMSATSRRGSSEPCARLATPGWPW